MKRSGAKRGSAGQGGTDNRRGISLLTKFFLTFTVIMILISVVSGLIAYNLMRNYVLNSQMDDIGRVMSVLKDQWIAYENARRNALTSEGDWVSEELKADFEASRVSLLDSLELYESFLGDGAYLYIAQPDGEITFSYPLLPNSGRYAAGRKLLPAEVVDHLLYHNDKYFFRRGEQYSDVLRSDALLRDSDDFYGLYADRDVGYFTIAQRISYIQPSTKEKVIGGSVIISVPVPYVDTVQMTLVRYFTLCTLIAVLFELVFLIYFTKRLTDPLRELGKAATRIAKGDFSQKLQRRSNDEIGVLVDSFNRMEDSLAKLEQMRSDFIANVSHELRTPMTSIGGFIDGILEGVIPPEKEEYYLQLVRGEITRLNTLINELLDMARLQSGHVQMHFRRLDINALASDCLAKLEPLFREKDLSAATDFAHDEEFAWFDENAIDRVLINLIQNAVKFTNSGGTITVHTARDKNAVTVTVEDTGKGISKEEQSMIFERFYKADRSRGLDKKGIGLGLSLVKNILQAHGQDIRVESEVGVGSKFIFTLPLHNPSGTEEMQKES